MPKKNPRRIGLAIVGAGRVGLFRGEVAARHPQVDWIGIAEKNPERARLVAERIGADFVTSRAFMNRLVRSTTTAARATRAGSPRWSSRARTRSTS